MDLLAEFMALEVVGVVAGFGFIVGYRLLTGRIAAARLIESKERGGVSPTRVQLLLFTLIGAGSYLALTLEELGRGTPTLPAVPVSLLLLLGGSHVTYLAGKSLLGTSRGNGFRGNDGTTRRSS